jgi:hypothetical protein
MVLWATNSTRAIKLAQFQIVYKSSSHRVICDCDCEQRVEARIQALLTTVDENSSIKFRSCYILKIIKTLKMEQARGFSSFPNECFRNLPRRPLSFIAFLRSLFPHLSLPNILEGSRVSLTFVPFRVRHCDM